ncbi:hypothetical protein H5410_021803 [Solanum commersonii]|uniref:DUF7746 domain-containing protein n=1 Tax=Solanum commersonii TaxID=4109 RepID=A0A9J5ZCZ9_SOLCO|nr:hypothetical protein H5410_021803 [Solanum commersonii]
MQAYLEGQKQKETFSSIAKEDTDDIRSYEKLQKKEMIFLLENSDLQRKDEPWKIFQRYLISGLYYPGESYKPRSYYEEILISLESAEFQHFSSMSHNPHDKSYNFSKIIIKQIISVEDGGMSTMKERQVNLNNTRMSFTYWDYIKAFDKVLYYNNDKHKHTWFIKVCAKIFANQFLIVLDRLVVVSSEFNKLKGYPEKNSGYATKPSMNTYYYPRPTPQDLLIEERDWNQTNTSYSRSEIYEWNHDGLTDRQLTILVHRMLMYATICKSVKNTYRTICKMIILGFTGHLQG